MTKKVIKNFGGKKTLFPEKLEFFLEKLDFFKKCRPKPIA